MSGHQHTASRRQVRKILGASAVDALDAHASAIQEIQDKTQDAFKAVEREIEKIESILHRPLVGRLRWLVTGC